MLGKYSTVDSYPTFKLVCFDGETESCCVAQASLELQYSCLTFPSASTLDVHCYAQPELSFVS